MVLRSRGQADLIVIGAGMAGLTAAHHAARCGLAVSLCEATPLYGGQIVNVEAIDGYPSVGEMPGIALAIDLLEKGRELGVSILETEIAALSVDDGMHLTTADGATHRARAVIVASGARLKTLDIPGEAEMVGRGVSQCASCDGPMFQGEDVAVIGGGDAAAQEALILAGFCRKVTLICRSAMRAKRDYVDRLTASANVEFIWDSVAMEIVGEGGVDGVSVRNTKDDSVSIFPCKGVFPFIGVAPNSTFLPDSVQRQDGYVITDAAYRTSVAGIFAAGAVRQGYGGHVAEAVGEGVSAATAAVSFLHGAQEA
jgi:thioredoxin reductase (NADPH)